MRVLLQRVSRARVCVDGQVAGQIDAGLLIFLGVGQGDGPADLDYVLNKSLHLRIFADDAGKMNRSLLESGGQALVVSQFTLHAQVRRGRRPSFTAAMPPEQAEAMYEDFVARMREQVATVQTGQFGASMQVELVNDGPVTIWIDSRERE